MQNKSDNDHSDIWIIPVLLIMLMVALADMALNPPTQEEIARREASYKVWAEKYPHCAENWRDVCAEGMLDSASDILLPLLPYSLTFLGVGFTLSFAYSLIWRWRKRRETKNKNP